MRAEAIWIKLDDEAFARKVEAALAYSPRLAGDVEAALRGAPFQGVRRFSEPKLAGEVDSELSAYILESLESSPTLKRQVRDIIEGIPLDAFRVECLRPVDNLALTDGSHVAPLFYEFYGERLVAAGHYEKVIHYREHVLPLALAIQKKVERAEKWERSAF